MSQVTFPEMLDTLKNSDDNMVTVGEGWFNGRAAYGGLVGALAVTGMLKLVPDNKPIRSFMANFAGPVSQEPVKIEPTLIRSGKSVTQAMVNVTEDGNILTHVSAAFGVAREATAAPSKVDFNPIPREAVPPLDGGLPMLPGFIKNFIIHWTGGAVPFSGAKDRQMSMWIKPKHDLSAHPTARVIAVADMPPPIMLSHFTKPVMASSLSWSLEFLIPPEDIDTEWFYLDYTMDASADGYSQQSGKIFDEHGNLCALSRQTMVYFE